MTREKLSRNLRIETSILNNSILLEFFYKDRFLCQSKYTNKFIFEEIRKNFINNVFGNTQIFKDNEYLFSKDILKKLADRELWEPKRNK